MHLALRIFLLLTSLSLIHSIDSFLISKPENFQARHFISHDIRQHFENLSCDIFLAFDNSHSELVQEIFNIYKNISTNGFYTIDIWSNHTNKSESHKFTSFKNIHGKIPGNICGLVFIVLEKFDEDEDGLHLFQLLTPHYGPLTRKDEDFYAFITREENSANKILLSPKFGLKIKYKLALYGKNGTLGLKTAHPYLDQGNPKLIDLESSEELFPDLTRNHYGRAIKMTNPNCVWRFEMEKSSDGIYHPRRGHYKYWLEAAMKTFNFTYSLFKSSLGGGTGRLFPNKTWLGAVGDVYYEEAEIGWVVGHIYSRHKYLEWSAPLSYEWIVFVCHKPKNYYSAQAIFWPLKWDSWLLVLICTLLATSFVKLILNLKSYQRGWWSIGEYIYATILEQDANTPTDDHSIRILCAFWLLFALIAATAYRAKLVGVIAFPISSWVPSTFEELAYSNFKMGLNVVGKGGAAYDLFRSSSSPVFKIIVSKMSIHPQAIECISMTQGDDFCCCVWEGISQFEGAKNISDRFGRSPLHRSASTGFFIDDGIVYQKRAIFRKHFDLTIWNAIEMGLVAQWSQMDWKQVRKWRQEWERSENITAKILPDDNMGPQKLQVAHFIGGYAIIASGSFFSFIIFLWEVFNIRLKEKLKIWKLSNP